MGFLTVIGSTILLGSAGYLLPVGNDPSIRGFQKLFNITLGVGFGFFVGIAITYYQYRKRVNAFKELQKQVKNIQDQINNNTKS